MSGLKRGGSPNQWKPGGSGNPGGRRSVTKALIAAGFNPDELCAEFVQRVVTCFRELNPGDKDQGQSWRWCADTVRVLVNLPNKPLEQNGETTLTDEEYQEELDLIAKERVDKMSPEERFKLLSNTAPNDTVQ